MANLSVMPQGFHGQFGHAVSPERDRAIERILDLPSGTAAYTRELGKTYPKNGTPEAVEAWESTLPSPVRRLREWGGWPLNQMSALSYIEKISGAPASHGGGTDDPDQVAVLLSRMGINLPQGVHVRDLGGIGWG